MAANGLANEPGWKERGCEADRASAGAASAVRAVNSPYPIQSSLRPKAVAVKPGAQSAIGTAKKLSSQKVLCGWVQVGLGSADPSDNCGPQV
jgi:hypothetical protein